MEYISHTISDAEAKRLEQMESRSNDTAIAIHKFFYKLAELGLTIKYRNSKDSREILWVMENVKEIQLSSGLPGQFSLELKY